MEAGAAGEVGGLRYARTAFVPDLHVPYHDPAALNCALRFLRVFAPSHVFLLGDVVDFYQLSTFSRDPTRVPELQRDLNNAVTVLARIRTAVPGKARVVMLEGNHEQRLRRYLWTRAPELGSLKSLAVPELLELERLGIEYVEGGIARHHDFLVKHGGVVRSKSGYTASTELDRAGISGISGHTHRLGQVYRSHYGGMLTWAEAGCLCSLQPDYLPAMPDWQHGLAYGYFREDEGRFEVHTTPIIGGKLVYDGKEVAA